MDYAEFISSKEVSPRQVGFDVDLPDVGDFLFPFQRHCVQWALKVGKAALFADTGLGKTRMQLAWANHIIRRTGGKVLILAPLVVAEQTVREALAVGLEISHERTQAGIHCPITITNYEMMDAFDAGAFSGIVLDESGILKNYSGKTKQAIINRFEPTPYKLACTATPAPNDHTELGNHAEFLDVMPSSEMLSRWFINDTMSAGSYRLKGHAADEFWRWVASWAISITKPSDLGDYSDDGYLLPALQVVEHSIPVDHLKAHELGQLFKHGDMSATKLHAEMRQTNEGRCAKAAELVNGSPGPWIVWCNTNYEADELRRLLPDAIEVRGSETPESKAKKLSAFSFGEAQTIITKPSLAGMGLNWQHCNQAVFVGLSYSYEALYQALRRVYRFGQKRPVTAHLICAESESGIRETLRAKEADHVEMQRQLVEAMRKAHHEVDRSSGFQFGQEMAVPSWIASEVEACLS